MRDGVPHWRCRRLLVNEPWTRAKTFTVSALVTVLVLAPVAVLMVARGGWLATTATDRGPDKAIRDPSTSATLTRAPVRPSPAGELRLPAPAPAPAATARPDKRASSAPKRNKVANRDAQSVGRAARHVFPVADCSASYAQAHHDYPAADVFAARGCLFVAPVTGRVDEVNRADRWQPDTNRGPDRGGLMVSIVGRDDVRYYGAHLETVFPGIRVGRIVKAGTPLGRVGDTGSARGVGTHLHFGLSWPTPTDAWWIRRGAVPPAVFLDAWRAGRDVSPVAATAKAMRAYGDDSRCRAYC